MNFTLSDFIQLGSVAVVISAVGYGLIRGIHYVLQARMRKREEYFRSFDAVVAQLSSSNPTSQLAAAVLLRRYFDMKEMQGDVNLRSETVNVISAMLKVLPVSIFQKTLGDSLAYAADLSFADLQRANLQDIYLGRKETDNPLCMEKADLFMADLSYSLLENINGVGAILYNSVLFNTQVKNSNFSGADFRGSDLRNVVFRDVVLNGADFTDAVNVPCDISKTLKNGIVDCVKPITTSATRAMGVVFFSMPGCLGKREELLTKEYKKLLELRGFSVIYYTKDDYPQYGQFTRIRESLMKSSGVIAFGFRQTKIKDGVSLPGTANEKQIKDRWLNTPWNELEVGMALMRGLPVLLVKDEGISNGVFDAKLSECFVATISANYDCRGIETNADYIRWLNKIK